MFKSQWKHNESRGWKKCVALISLCVLLSYWCQCPRRWKQSLAVSKYSPHLIGVCACVSDWLLESDSFQCTGPESMAINLHHLPLVSPSSCSFLAVIFSPSILSRARPCLEFRSSQRHCICYSSPACNIPHTASTHTHTHTHSHTHTHTHTHTRCNPNNNIQIMTSLLWLTHRVEQTNRWKYKELSMCTQICI